MQQGAGRGLSPDVTEPPRLLPDRWWGQEGRIGATVHRGASESSGIGGQGGLGVMRCGDRCRVWLEAWPRPGRLDSVSAARRAAPGLVPGLTEGYEAG